MGCYRCKAEFKLPAELTGKGKTSHQQQWKKYWENLSEKELIGRLSESEIAFLIKFWNQMAAQTGHREFKPDLNSRTSGVDISSESLSREWLICTFRHYFKVSTLLKVRANFSTGSKNKRLPAVSFFAKRVLADENVVFHPGPSVRLNLAALSRKVLRQVLRLPERGSGIIGIRTEVIRDCYARRDTLKGELFTTIAKELDANPSIVDQDPALSNWRREFHDPLLNWQQALEHTVLKNRVGRIFSGVGKHRLT